MYSWFYLFKEADFIAEGLHSKTLSVDLQDVGNIEMLLVKGNMKGVVVGDEYLPLNLNNINPTYRGEYGLYMDDSRSIYLGIKNDS